MAGEVAALGSVILGIATTIQSLGNNWYVANAAWKKFPGDVELLQEKVDFWEREAARNIGSLSLDPALIKRLSVAKTLLEKEQDKLKKRAGSGYSGCWPRVSTTVFPAKVGLSIQGAMEAFDDILETLKSRQEIKEVLNKARMDTAVSDSIDADDRYVPFVDSEKEICHALECAEGPAVVLLHGGPGYGKSTLARNMVVHYNKLPMGGKTPKFDLVFFLACGPGAKAEDTQSDIIRRLGSEPEPNLSGENGVQIEHRLKGLLTGQKILLILDDVNFGDFLHKLKIVKLCGSDVRCLVTSQRADLCYGVLEKSKYTSIQIQTIDHETATKILASHLELPSCHIPARLQRLANKMIAETQLIPLALASLASAIDHSRPDDLNVWEDASAHFFEALKSEIPSIVLEGKYLRSFWATMGLAIGSLNEHAKKLLFLVHACRGPFVPEEIVQVLYRSTKLNELSGNFSIAKDTLANRQMIKISTSSNSLDKHVTTYSWSMHCLQKRYIEEEMKECRDSMFTLLTRQEEDAAPTKQHFGDQIKDVEEKMVTTVCALYLTGELAGRAASKMCIPLEGYRYHGRKKAMEPITFLLGCLVSDWWTKTARYYAMKIFVMYICNDGHLYEEGIVYILGLPSVALTMWKALKDMVYFGSFRARDNNLKTPSLKKFLVGQLVEGVETNMQMRALQVLGNVAHRCHEDPFCNWFIVPSRSPECSVLEGTIRLLRTTSDPQVQIHCGVLLANMAKAISLYPNKKVEIVVSCPGLLDGLVNSLSKDYNPSLQKYVSLALKHLSQSSTMNLKVRILNHPQLLLELVGSLSKDVDPSVQKNVLEMLAYLADDVDQNKVTILTYTSSAALLKELARSLCQNEIGDLLPVVAQVFASLVKVDDSSLRSRIGATEGVMRGLINLSNDESCGQTTQRFAREALLLLDPTEANKNNQCLQSGQVNHPSASSNSREGRTNVTPSNLDNVKHHCHILSDQYVKRAEMGDFEVAMEDFERMEYKSCVPAFYLQERGMIKQMMGNLSGALEDLNEGLQLEKDDYEMLKHRGYVKFLMKDEDGALADAESALRIKPSSRVDREGYGKGCLGASSVEYLGYTLK